MSQKKLTLSRNKKISGVCAGIAEFLGWDATLIRTLWALATIFSGGGFLIGYIICAFIFPKPPDDFDIDRFRSQ